MAKVVVSRTLSVHKEHELLLKLESAGLGDDEAQAIINSKKNTLASTLIKVVRAYGDDMNVLDSIEKLLSFKNGVDKAETVSIGKYADEEVASTYSYVSGYSKSKIVTDQVKQLRELFPDIEIPDPDESLAPQVGSPSEGTFVILPWELVAPTYGEAVGKAFALLEKAYGGKFINYYKGQLKPNYLRESDRKKECLNKLREQQRGNVVLLIPAQFGILHRGRSVRRARIMMAKNEFGFGAWEIVLMLLTHLDRLKNYNDLWIDGAGDEFSPGGDGVFSDSVCFNFRDDRLRFVDRYLDLAFDGYGSVSGFLALPS